VTVLGRPCGVRGIDPVAVARLPTASHRRPGHDPAVAPGLGETTLDPTPRPPTRRPAHPAGAAPVGPATDRREPLLGLPTHPRRTRWAWLPDRSQYRVVDSQASRHRPCSSPRRAQLAVIPAGTSPRRSRHRLLLRSVGLQHQVGAMLETCG
jgi:hypothetical protein